MKLKSCIKVWILMLAMVVGLPAFAMGKACYDLPKQDLSKEEIYERLVNGYYLYKTPKGLDVLSSRRFYSPDYSTNIRSVFVDARLYNSSENMVYPIQKEIIESVLHEFHKYTGLELRPVGDNFEGDSISIFTILVPDDAWQNFIKNKAKKYFEYVGWESVYYKLKEIVNVDNNSFGFTKYDLKDGYTRLIFEITNQRSYKNLEKGIWATYFEMLISTQVDPLPDKYPSILNEGNLKKFSTFDKYLLCAKYSTSIPINIENKRYFDFILREILKLQKKFN